MYFHHFRHLGRHLEFLKTLNDDRLSSSRILNGNVLPTRIHQEKKLYTRLPGPSKICHIRAGLVCVVGKCFVVFYVFSFPPVVYVGTLNLIASIPGPSILTLLFHIWQFIISFGYITKDMYLKKHD